MGDFNYKEYLNLINSKEYINLYNYYTNETFWEISNTARQELPHSSFLKWLLDINGSHGLGEKPLRKFIECLLLAWENSKDDSRYQRENNIFNNKNNQYCQMLKFGAFKILSMDIDVEHPLENMRRADIFIESKILFESLGEETVTFCIENKVSSTENHDNKQKAYQTELYEKDLFEEKDNYIIPVFLSPLNTPPKSKEFLFINYQMINEYVITPLIMDTADKTLVNYRLTEYQRCLGPQSKDFFTETINKSVKSSNIMAISNIEKDCAIRLLLEDSTSEAATERRKLLTTVFTALRTGDEEANNLQLRNSDKAFWKTLARLYDFLIASKEINLTYDENNKNTDYKSELKSAIKLAVNSGSSKTLYEFNGSKYQGGGKGDVSTLGCLGYELIKEFINDNPKISFNKLTKTIGYTYAFLDKDEYDKYSVNDLKCSKLVDYFVCDYPNYEEAEKHILSQKGYNLSKKYASVTVDKKKYYVYRWWSGLEIESLIAKLKMENRIKRS